MDHWVALIQGVGERLLDHPSLSTEGGGEGNRRLPSPKRLERSTRIRQPVRGLVRNMTTDNHDHWCGLGWYHAGPCTCICGALGLMSKGEFIEQDSGVSPS